MTNLSRIIEKIIKYYDINTDNIVYLIITVKNLFLFFNNFDYLSITFRNKNSIKKLPLKLSLGENKFYLSPIYSQRKFLVFNTLLDFFSFLGANYKNKSLLNKYKFFVIKHLNGLFILNTYFVKRYYRMILKRLIGNLDISFIYRALNGEFDFKIYYNEKVLSHINKYQADYFYYKGKEKFSNLFNMFTNVIMDYKCKKILYLDYKYGKLEYKEFFKSEGFKNNINIKESRASFYSQDINAQISPFNIIKDLIKLEPRFEFAKYLHFYVSHSTNVCGNLDGRIMFNYIKGYGVDEKEDEAKLKALIENIERYSAGITPPPHVLYKIKWREIKRITEEITGLHFNKIGEDEEITCVKGTFIDLTNNLSFQERGDLLLPIDIVYYPIYNKNRFYYANSSGCAAHFSKERAVMNSIMELCERDSIALMWLNRLSLPQLDKKTIPLEFIEKIQNFEKETKMTLYLLDGSLDKPVPCIITMVYNKRNKYPYFFMTAACSTSLYEALRKSLNEMFGYLGFANNDKKQSISHENVKKPSDHANFYKNPQNKNLIEFLRKGTKVKYISLEKKFKNNIDLAKYLNKVSGGLILADITSPYASSIGVFVVRVLSTKLVPIWFGNKQIPLWKRRIRYIEMNFEEFKKTKEPLTDDILFLHPFG
ncbi:MAG: hypothetical protein KatS3mg095_0946 [Candidatus Parcubacteria bacterium]|nr:MAG: hypothetical protein KatS3mg095_0946 [Candidatus Parcubacteria bacterium]